MYVLALVVATNNSYGNAMQFDISGDMSATYQNNQLDSSEGLKSSLRGGLGLENINGNGSFYLDTSIEIEDDKTFDISGYISVEANEGLRKPQVDLKQIHGVYAADENMLIGIGGYGGQAVDMALDSIYVRHHFVDNIDVTRHNWKTATHSSRLDTTSSLSQDAISAGVNLTVDELNISVGVAKDWKKGRRLLDGDMDISYLVQCDMDDVVVETFGLINNDVNMIAFTAATQLRKDLFATVSQKFVDFINDDTNTFVGGSDCSESQISLVLDYTISDNATLNVKYLSESVFSNDSVDANVYNEKVDIGLNYNIQKDMDLNVIYRSTTNDQTQSEDIFTKVTYWMV
jgi:hypothetical protein